MGLFDRLRSFFRAEPRWEPGLQLSDWKFVDDREWVGRLGDDDAAVQVYADWLEERGDGRHELIRRALRSEALGPFVNANADALLGPLARRRREASGRRRPELELGWSRGVLRRAGVRTEQPWADASTLLRLPLASHLTSLGIGLAPPNVPLVQDPSVLELGGRHLDRLHVGDFLYPDECELSWALLGDLSGLWRAQPALRELTLQGSLEDLGEIDAPRLQRLVRETCALTKKELAQLATARLPELRELELWFGEANAGADFTLDDVRPLFSRPWPQLTSLGLRNALITDELVDLVLASPLAAQLEVLDLSKGCLSDAGAQTLLAGRAQLPNLQRLDLSENILSGQHLEALARLCPTVELAEQRLDDMEEDLRYVAVSE